MMYSWRAALFILGLVFGFACFGCSEPSTSPPIGGGEDTLTWFTYHDVQLGRVH